MYKFNNNIPMSTQLLEQYEDEKRDIRFTKVKIWLMHMGLNDNGSIFKKDIVQKAIPTLANTPIMGSVGLTQGINDFEGHESSIEIKENGEVKFINKTFPFGVIPEKNNAKFETRLGDDMIEREYLTVEGLLWNKWDEAVDILYSKHGVTGQSMELADDYKGIFDGEYFEFTDFKFFGACLLGDHVDPAMNNSTVELTFSKQTNKIIEDKMRLFSKINFNKEGGHDVSEKVETIFEENKEAEVVETEETKVPEEQPEEAPKKRTRKKAAPKEDVKEEVQPEEEVIEEKQPVDTVTVEEQSIDEVAKIREEARQEQENLPEPASLIKVLDQEYSIQDLEVKLQRLEELEGIEVKYAKLNEEVKSEKVEALFNNYGSALSAEEITELKEKSQNFSVAELETQICATIGKKTFTNQKEFSKEKPEIKFSKVAIATEKELTHKNPLDEILEKL